MKINQSSIIAKVTGKFGSSTFAKGKTRKGNQTEARQQKNFIPNQFQNISQKDCNHPVPEELTPLEQYYHERIIGREGTEKERKDLFKLFNRFAMAYLDTFWNSLTDKERSVWKREGNKQRREPWSGLDYYRHINMRRAFLNWTPLRKPPDYKNSKIKIISRENGYPAMPEGKKWKMCVEGQTLPASPADSIKTTSLYLTMSACFPPPYNPPTNARCNPLKLEATATGKDTIKIDYSYKQPGPGRVTLYDSDNYIGDLSLPKGTFTYSGMDPATNHNFTAAAFLHEQGCGSPQGASACTWGIVDVQADPSDQGTASGPTEGIKPASHAQISASPEEGYQLDSWSASAGLIDDPTAESTFIIMPPCENVTATAHFERWKPDPVKVKWRAYDHAYYYEWYEGQGYSEYYFTPNIGLEGYWLPPWGGDSCSDPMYVTTGVRIHYNGEEMVVCPSWYSCAEGQLMYSNPLSCFFKETTKYDPTGYYSSEDGWAEVSWA